jgi:hypothetical protein
MNVLNTSPLPFAAIAMVTIAQQMLTWLRRSDRKTAYLVARPVLLIFWLVLGLAMVASSVWQTNHPDPLFAISGIALGMGLTLSGVGQTLERGWLQTIGVPILAAGPLVAGVDFILKDNALAGLIALALGIGILVSALRGWPGGIGQMVVGAVILGSGAMLLISALTLSPGQPDTATLAIGVVMLLLSLWGIVGGALTLIGGLRPAKQAEGSTA